VGVKTSFQGAGRIMLQEQLHGNWINEFSVANPNSAEPASLGEWRIEEFIIMQAELVGKIHEQINRQCCDRAKLASDVSLDFAFRLISARSIAEASTACWELISREFEMMAIDGKHLVTDGSQFIQAGLRLWSSETEQGLINSGGNAQPDKYPR
jgi:hypothetical protein